MSMRVGKCPVPWPNIMNNQNCLDRPEIPDEFARNRCSPYVRLNCIPTKSTLAKKCDYSCAPKDHLDIALSACYDHHRQWWAPKSQTLMQCATYRLFPWGRAQERVCRLKSCLPDTPCMTYCNAEDQIMVNHEPYQNDASHMDCSVGSPHTSNTNKCFARPNIDGLFYNC